MIDNMSQQQRMILAMVLSVLFFIVYEAFMPKPQYADLNQTAQTTQIAQSATSATTLHAAPQAQTPSMASSQVSNRLASPASADTKSATSTKVISTIHAEKFMAKIDALGRVEHFEFKEKKFLEADGTFPVIISKENTLLPLEVRFSDPQLNQEAFSTPYTADKDEITVSDNGTATLTLTQKLSKTTVTKKITFHKLGNYDVEVSLTNPQEYYITNGSRPTIDTDRYTFNGVLIEKADGKREMIDDGKAKGGESFPGAKIVASSNKYFSSVFYNFDQGFNVVIDRDKEENPLPFVKGSQAMKLEGYIGPKEYDTLAAIDPHLTEVIEYGFFTFISKPLFSALKAIYHVVGNWGWAIVIITILLRLLLYPLTYKGMVSMNKMKALSPKVKEIREKYKSEPQKMNAKMMELYKKHGANPMGGCLPMLLQIPIFFAIYRVLLNTVELKHAPWIGWIHDLSVMDPYFILPILMGATMFWQQHLTPNNFTDPMQEKIMKFLPLIFTFFFVTFPAGLTLYWFVNNLFSVAQQYYVNKLFEKEKIKA